MLFSIQFHVHKVRITFQGSMHRCAQVHVMSPPCTLHHYQVLPPSAAGRPVATLYSTRCYDSIKKSSSMGAFRPKSSGGRPQPPRLSATTTTTSSRTSSSSRRRRHSIRCMASAQRRSSSAAQDSSNSSRSSSSSSVKSVVVVGGGIGGLVVAGLLARQPGFKVTLLEKNEQVGGRCQSVTRAGHRFDTGPSLLLFKHKYEEAFAGLGSRLQDHVQVVRVQPAAYRVFFQGGGGHLDMLYDVQAMTAQLEAVEAGAGAKYLDWLAAARSALSVGMAHFIERDFDGWADFLGLWRLAPLLGSINVVELLAPHSSQLSRRFKDPRLAAMFTFQDLYVGLSPYSAPGVFSLLAATELTDGVWYPIGGFGRVVAALRDIDASLGVDVCCGQSVARIMHDDGRVTGVQLSGSGEVLPADIVVTNADVASSYRLLGGADPSSTAAAATAAAAAAKDSKTGERGSGSNSSSPNASSSSTAPSYFSKRLAQLDSMDYSAGIIAFNWCVNTRPELLQHHNVFLSSQYRESWVRAAAPQQLVVAPNFYVHVPSRTDPSAAPPGCDSIMVLLPVANLQQMMAAARSSGASSASAAAAGSSAPQPSRSRPSDGSSSFGDSDNGSEDEYAELVAAGRRAVLRTLRDSGVGDLQHHITHEQVITPREWQTRYALHHGAAFGLSHGLGQLALMRPAIVDPQLRGLYHVGASSRPGNGVPLVMISAQLAAQRILQKEQHSAATQP